MKARSNVLAAVLMSSGALLTAAAGYSMANAADETTAATPPAVGQHGPHGGGLGHLYSKLGLTAEQQSSIKAIMATAKPQMTSLHEQMKANHLKMMQTKPDDPNYASVVAEVAQSNAALSSQRTTQGAEVRAQMYAVLTPAQKTQLTALEAAWAASPHHGPWGGPHHGAAPPDGE